MTSYSLKRRGSPSQSGFTLVEMVMVIVITGIIGGMVAMFLKAPIQQYQDISRRAELTDIADTALYRLSSDISTAVPNSVRVLGCGATPCVEFLPTKDGGRYRALADSATGVGDILDFTLADSSVEIIGPPIAFAVSDVIVVGSTQSDGNPPYDITSSGVRREVSASSVSSVSFTATQFPAFAKLDSQRFDVVDGTQQAVTYSCEGTLGTLDAHGNGQAKLVRHWGYGFNPNQIAPTGFVGASARLADHVSGCVIDYSIENQRLGLLGVRLTLTSGGETVSLYNEIHVSNVP
ncbi:MAG: type II secretion system protein [Gallionella sp.]|nr:type II secretion system protein [Gallionella sp.]MDD4958517.1 type II secretion system protein [Gallionella sp.]